MKTLRNVSGFGASMVIALAFCLLSPSRTEGQISPWPQGSGMGGANLALAKGFMALEWNPANLALPGGPEWSISLRHIGASAAVGGASFQDLADIFSAGGEGDPALVSRVPETGLTLDLVAEGFSVSKISGAADLPDPGGGATIPSLAFSWRGFGVSVRNELILSGNLSRELTDLTVNGFNPERIQDYAVKNTSFQGFSYTSITLGSGLALSPTFAVGASIRGVMGNRLMQGRLFEPDIDLDDQSLSVSAVAVESPGATGFGLDLGAVYRPWPAVTLGFSVRNVVQRMVWDESLVVYAADITDQDFDEADVDEILDRFQGEDMDPEGATLQMYRTAEGLFQESFFPRVFRLGGALASEWGGSLQVMYSATQGKGRIKSPWDDRFSVGVEQRLPFLTLRGGFASTSSGMQTVTAGLGIHIGPVNLDAMAGTISGTSSGDVGNEFDGYMATLGLSLVGR